MRRSHFPFASLLLLLVVALQVHSAPSGPLIKHLSTLLKWTTARSSSKTPQSDADYLQFEDGYLVETVVEGNEIGVVPYQIRVSDDGELYAVDEVKSNIVKITPPISQYSRARLVAGSFQGYTGHVDEKSNEARFNHPRGVTMDDKGNVYVADTLNLAIRKIGDSGVTTIAGGKSNVAGYRDGPSEDAKFSADFDVVYVHSTCSLLVVDRGNAALREIALNQEDCDYQSSSITVTDLLMVVGAVLTGYITCLLQQGFGSSFFSRTRLYPVQRLYPESDFKEHPIMEKQIPMMENMKEEPKWPTFGQLLTDLLKLALEALASVFVYFVPGWFRSYGPKKGLTPLKDSLMMPEDEVEPPLAQRQTVPVPLSETRKVHTPNSTDKYSEMKPPKMKSASFRDPSLSSKHQHRSSKRQEYAEFYESGEVPMTGRSKSHKEKTRHRQRDKSGEAVFGEAATEAKPVDMKPVDYSNPKFEHYIMRSKYRSDNPYQF